MTHAPFSFESEIQPQKTMQPVDTWNNNTKCMLGTRTKKKTVWKIEIEKEKKGKKNEKKKERKKKRSKEEPEGCASSRVQFVPHSEKQPTLQPTLNLAPEDGVTQSSYRSLTSKLI